jgi:prepilin-type N-terminal cleavage/methylation domain-containing protein
MLKKMHQGFTLIELVVVIVILGILAAVAIPKYIDLSGSAQTAATASVAGSLSSASAVNYAARKTGGSGVGSAVVNCTDVAATLQGGLPSGYSIASLAVAANASASCTLNGPNSSTNSFTAIGIP